MKEHPLLRGCRPLVALLVAATLAHLPSLFNGFVWDDDTFILWNPVLREARNIPALFTKPETWGTGTVNPYYRPLTMLTLLLDTLLWGKLPAGFHATNVLLHLGVCALLLAVLRRLFAPGVALAAALVFAVHPAHAEPVAYISARGDLVCAVFLLAAFLAWERYGRTGGQGALALAAFAYFAALLSKIAVGLFPAVFALYGLLFFRRRLRVLDLVPFAAAALCYLVVRAAVLEMDTWPDQSLHSRVATAGPLIVRYFLMALSPAHLGVFHDVSRHTTFDATVLEAWGVIAAAVAITAIRARQMPRAALGLAWFLAGIIPVSGIASVLYPALAADRYLYIPLLGATIVVGTCLERLVALRQSAPQRRLAAGVAACALLALAGLTMGRGRHWRDSLTLWERAVFESPRSPYALTSLGWVYETRGRYEEAERVLRSSLEVNEAFPETHLNLASLAFRRNDLEAAAWHTHRAFELGRILHKRGNDAIVYRAAERALELNLFDAETLGMPAGPRRGTGPAAMAD